MDTTRGRKRRGSRKKNPVCVAIFYQNLFLNNLRVGNERNKIKYLRIDRSSADVNMCACNLCVCVHVCLYDKYTITTTTTRAAAIAATSHSHTNTRLSLSLTLYNNNK